MIFHYFKGNVTLSKAMELSFGKSGPSLQALVFRFRRFVLVLTWSFSSRPAVKMSSIPFALLDTMPMTCWYKGPGRSAIFTQFLDWTGEIRM